MLIHIFCIDIEEKPAEKLKSKTGAVWLSAAVSAKTPPAAKRAAMPKLGTEGRREKFKIFICITNHQLHLDGKRKNADISTIDLSPYPGNASNVFLTKVSPVEDATIPLIISILRMFSWNIEESVGIPCPGNTDVYKRQVYYSVADPSW